jgi:hypothetical protein
MKQIDWKVFEELANKPKAKLIDIARFFGLTPYWMNIRIQRKYGNYFTYKPWLKR